MNVEIQVNDVYKPLLNDETRTQICYGGSSSGKSYFFIAQRMILDILNGGRNYLAIRNTANTLRGSVYNEAVKGIAEMGLMNYFKINKSEMTITCNNGYQAILKGLDDVEKIKSITPAKGVLTDILIEEATETKEDDIKQLEKRLRGLSDKTKRMTLIFNPVYKSHWIYKQYFAGKFKDTDTWYKDDHVLILKTTYKNNINFLSHDDIYGLENETSEYFYNVYTLGNWGVLGSLVFTNWSVEDLSSEVSRLYPRYYGLDFGFCVDSETEILTKAGWKKQDTLTNNDITLTINPQSGLSEWQKINNVHRFIGNYDMMHIEAKAHSSFTTNNHRWLIESKNKWVFKTTECLGGADIIPCAKKCVNLPKQKKYSNAFVELIAWYWTKGQDHGGGISIWQNEGKNADRIRLALKRHFGEQLVKTRNGRNRAKAGWKERPLHHNKCCHFAINLNGSECFKNVAPGKIVSHEFINNLTETQLKLFINVSIRADGSTTNYGTRVICQSKKERLEHLQAACSLLGIRTTLKETRKESIYKEFRLTLFKNNDKVYIGEYIKRRPLFKRFIYHGLVWCPTTPNGTWLARRNGTVYFTGNTNDPSAFSGSCIKDKNLFITNEFYEYGLTNDMIADLVKPIIGNEQLMCDSAEPKSIQELRDYGVMAMPCVKGKSSVNYGIQYLQQFHIVIHKTLQNAINEFSLYQWDKNRDGEAINKPIDRYNHFIDATRYAHYNREKSGGLVSFGIGEER